MRKNGKGKKKMGGCGRERMNGGGGGKGGEGEMAALLCI